jgi:hypothetical protein
MKLLNPVPGARISQYFGENPGLYGYDAKGHKGIDFGVVTGTEVRAAADGTVYTNDTGAAGFGLYVRQAIAGATLYYGHLSRIVKTGTVAAGDVIALSGNTGNSMAPHLHFEVRINGVSVDPLPYIMSEGEEKMTTKPVSVLGIQFQTAAEVNTQPTDMIAASGIEWIKGIDIDLLWKSRVFTKQRILARLYVDKDEVIMRDYMARGAEGAEDYFDLCKPRYGVLKSWGILDVCGPNEPHPNGDNYLAYEAFELRWAQLVIAMGMRPWVWSIGVGWFTGPAGFAVGSIQVACAAGGGLEVHEYGAPSVQDGGGFWTMRIRKTLDELYAAGLDRATARVFVGETGVDGGVIDWDDPDQPEFYGKKRRRGWKEWSDWAYPAQLGLPVQGGLTRELYWRQVSAYDDKIIDEVPEVVAITPFIAHPQPDWADFVWDTELCAKVVEKHASAPVDAGGLTAAQLAQAETQVIPMVPGHGLWDYIVGKGWTLASLEFALGDWPAAQWGFDAEAGTRTLCAWSGATGVVELFTRQN